MSTHLQDTETSKRDNPKCLLLENHDLLNPSETAIPEEKKDYEEELEFVGSLAFLGPTLWDKTLPDFKLESLDFNELLEENNNLIDNNPTHHSSYNPQSLQACSLSEASFTLPELSSLSSDSPTYSASIHWGCGNNIHTSQVEFCPTDLALASAPGQRQFDPVNHSFSDDDLKPQPIIKKSKKHIVSDELKDEKYWTRRSKNNVAAKRSRDARRIKENQIVLRASYLEKENASLKEERQKLKEENLRLLECLKKYEKF
ncbi:hepatic leukemia factor-like [Limulus polyphemus]|uniref:Hepatic leukemia factor-like n=1 Tax=Limulus polyphemus TaxID=6850 RepID=A0ABM1C097_LIMPO|nr:hepatic leukemia factor-like [Limulus polyphemus]